MDFTPEMELDHAVDSRLACAYIGVCPASLRRLRESGLLPAFLVQTHSGGRPMWRFRIRDLLIYTKRRQNHLRVWDLTHSELPARGVARLVGLTEASVHQARYRGSLEDYTPLAICKYLRKQLRREVRSDLKKEIRNLKKTVRLLRAKNAELSFSQSRPSTRLAKNLPASRPRVPQAQDC